MVDGAKIGATTLVVREAEVFCAEIDEEIVMMSQDLDSYCGINEIGSRIWQLIESPVLVSDLCGILLDEFEVDPEVCEREVTTFLSQLVSEGLAKTVDDSAA